jgi:hypothetical protein
MRLLCPFRARNDKHNLLLAMTNVSALLAMTSAGIFFDPHNDELNIYSFSLDSSQGEGDGYHVEKKGCYFRVSEVVFKEARDRKS